MTSIDLFDFQLPSQLIAQRPADQRDASRLMTLDRRSGAIGHHSFDALPGLLHPSDTLVLNNTKVIPARILATRRWGGRVEILLVRDLGGGRWKAMVKGLAKLKEGEWLQTGDYRVRLGVRVEGGMVEISFGSQKEEREVMAALGQTPLPPYIIRPDGQLDKEDTERYQTIFAKTPGSCAAPTAGLHFTSSLLESIRNHGVKVVEMTLHVGPGTFRPVKCLHIEDHRMDPEYYEIPERTARIVNQTMADGGRVVTVGSTATRALESSIGPDGRLTPGHGETSLYITPGFQFRITGGIVTNFHLPRSTLLVMVSSFAGRERTLAAYAEAVKEKYRFFSYGDAIFIV
ncbi:MAG: tRNA preQ1(34) S-adenosylmethionine ribosyltransferase-isomerase QueA [Nitrospinota bacterium]|nr:tRNA preQ1(34) S-adenosylmethionine ribosyltransferase-isomerase QueA [Nitrospinota bacterium]